MTANLIVEGLMVLKGFIREALLQEHPEGSESVEMILKVQGVGPNQPRVVIVPFPLLLDQPELEPETVKGRSFAAEVEPDDEGRWIVQALNLAGRALRDE
ncbi:MAG: hypothetical protein AB7I30_11705 [Isosphaeraceae bacterium]